MKCQTSTLRNFIIIINPLTPNDLYISRTAPLTSKRCILYIYLTNIGTEYFKHALYSPFFSLPNAVCFIMLTCLVPVLFKFYIQGVLKLKKNNSGAKGLIFHLGNIFNCFNTALFIVWNDASVATPIIEPHFPSWHTMCDVNSRVCFVLDKIFHSVFLPVKKITTWLPSELFRTYCES